MNFTKHFFEEANKSISRIDEKKIEAIAKLLDN